MGFGSNLRALNFFIGGMLPDLFSCCMPSVNSFSHGFWWFWSACPLACLLATSTPIEVVGLLSSVTYVLPVVCSRYFTSCTIYHYGNLVTRLWWTHPKFWNLVVFLLRPNTSLIHWPYFLLLLALLYGNYTHCRLQHPPPCIPTAPNPPTSPRFPRLTLLLQPLHWELCHL